MIIYYRSQSVKLLKNGETDSTFLSYWEQNLYQGYFL